MSRRRCCSCCPEDSDVGIFDDGFDSELDGWTSTGGTFEATGGVLRCTSLTLDYIAYHRRYVCCERSDEPYLYVQAKLSELSTSYGGSFAGLALGVVQVLTQATFHAGYHYISLLTPPLSQLYITRPNGTGFYAGRYTPGDVVGIKVTKEHYEYFLNGASVHTFDFESEVSCFQYAASLWADSGSGRDIRVAYDDFHFESGTL